MRWKDFMANSLPRSWTKSRRRNSILKNTRNSEQLENQENNNDIQALDNKFHFDQNDNHFRYENKCMCVKEIPIVVPRSSIIPRRNRNLSTYNSLPKTNPFLQDAASPEVKLGDDDKSDDTTPRIRSRIKTNPWLPSPKIPAASLTINFAASNNSLVSSPTGSRCSSMDRSLGSRSLNGSRSSSLYSRSRSLDSPKDFDLIDLVKFEDDCQSGSGKLSSGIGLASDGEGTSISSMESEGFVFYESLDDLRPSPDPRKRGRHSFNYEDHFESMVESFNEKAQDSCTSLDLLQDRDAAILTPPPRRNGARILVAKESLDEVDDGIGHSDDENVHLYVNLDYQKPQTEIKREVKKKPKVSPKPRLSISSTSSNDSEMVEIDLRAQSLNLNEPKASSTPKYNKRPIEEIRANLEAKVHQLRRDKFVVEEKIRAAQEEERVREKLRYHQQVTLQRKQILVRTLFDLRSKLEGQCQRIQTSYPVSTHDDTAVLDE